MHTSAIDITALDWRKCGGAEGGEASKLIATLTLGGSDHHLEAFEIVSDEDDEQRPHEDCAEQFYELSNAFGGDGPFVEVEIDGRLYVLFMSPFCT